jgi:hypothetical protein
MVSPIVDVGGGEVGGFHVEGERVRSVAAPGRAVASGAMQREQLAAARDRRKGEVGGRTIEAGRKRRDGEELQVPAKTGESDQAEDDRGAAPAAGKHCRDRSRDADRGGDGRQHRVEPQFGRRERVGVEAERQRPPGLDVQAGRDGPERADDDEDRKAEARLD